MAGAGTEVVAGTRVATASGVLVAGATVAGPPPHALSTARHTPITGARARLLHALALRGGWLPPCPNASPAVPEIRSPHGELYTYVTCFLVPNRSSRHNAAKACVITARKDVSP